MYLEASYEWTISPEQTFNYSSVVKAWNLEPAGYLGHNGSMQFMRVRPTFYLKADVLYSSGDGTRENPYRIGL